MAPQTTQAREAQAEREAGHTQVSRGVALALSAAFLLPIVAVTALELRRDARADEASPWRELAAAPALAWQAARSEGPLAGNRRLLGGMNGFEDALEDGSLVAERALSGFQWLLTRGLGAGSEQVVVGRRGWLYFRPALDYLTGPGFLDARALAARAEAGRTWEGPARPDPLPALADFAAQLAERGIGLVVVPVPVKPSIHPEGLAPGLAAAVPLENPSFDAFLARLADLEIPAYAPSARLAEVRRDKPWPLFLRTDTHWTPQAMEEAAAGLAGFLDRHVPLPEREVLELGRREAWVEGRGDLVALLRLPAGRPLFRPEPVLTQPVVGADGEPWRPDPSADVLELGDSFTNIYSQAELGWGEGAGFAEQLAYFLRRPVDKLAINAGGPAALRERLASGIASGQDRLAGKRLVVYQFSARELASGDWRPVSLAPAAPGEAAPEAARRPEDPLPARGFVVWESNRSGDWRIWSRRLEGSAPRQLSPDEPGLQHCCTHISPDGSQLVYLSRPVSPVEYPELEVPGELRLVRLDSGESRTLAWDARPYGWGNRAAVWRSDREIVHIDGDGLTRLLDVETGASSPLTREPRRRLAWLLDPSLRHAVSGSPSFSSYDAVARRVLEAPRKPGCEPYFSHDGRSGFWVEGAGGPIRRIDLETGAVRTLLEHRDPRIPGAQRYAYFPMLSRDGRMLVFGASPGDHDHFRSNYDIFVAPVDPASLELQGRPLRMTAHPASDRYPDVHVETLDLDRWRETAPPVPLGAARPAAPVARATGPFAVMAELAACSRTPSLREISPYRDALIVCEWRVREALAGEPPGGHLRVAHWAWRDGARQAIASAAPGFAAPLRVEPVTEATPFGGYPVFDTLRPAPALPLHYARDK
jgi:alginate O-acetyltransferase complex protein AlgJ